MPGVLRFIPGRLYHYAKSMFYAVVGADTEESLRQYHLGSDDEATTERINRRALELATERAGLRLWRGGIVFCLGAIPIVFLAAVPKWHQGEIRTLHWVLGGCLVYVEFFLLIALLFVRARVASLNAQLQVLEYENVLVSFDQAHEKRAANLFFKHQAELKQYYDQTLRQNKQAFVIGIVCVGFGLGAIVAIATLLLVHSASTTPAKITASAMGLLSALLSGFVARIYLRVYEGSADALGSFHDRLVNTNHYHLANLMISMISSDSERADALSTLANQMARPRLFGETEDP